MTDIISITTVPWRVEKFHIVLESLLNQQYVTPYKIVITISTQDFADWRSDFTAESVKLIDENDIEVLTVDENLSVYKRYNPIMLRHQNIVIADDDIQYANDWLKQFQLTHEQYPNDIIVNTSNRKFNVLYSDCELLCSPLSREAVAAQYGKKLTNERITANGGVYIPANVLSDQFLNYELSSKNCAKDDELWLIATALHEHVTIRIVNAAAKYKNVYKTNNFHKKALCNTYTYTDFCKYVSNLRRLYSEFNDFILQFAV